MGAHAASAAQRRRGARSSALAARAGSTAVRRRHDHVMLKLNCWPGRSTGSPELVLLMEQGAAYGRAAHGFLVEVPVDDVGPGRRSSRRHQRGRCRRWSLLRLHLDDPALIGGSLPVDGVPGRHHPLGCRSMRPAGRDAQPRQQQRVDLCRHHCALSSRLKRQFSAVSACRRPDRVAFRR